MKKLTDRQKLDLIDYLCAEMECDSKFGGKLNKFAGDIYKIAHPCENCKHPLWEEESLKMYKSLKAEKII